MAARQVTATVQILQVDPAKHTVMIKGPDGFMRTVTVQDPEMAGKLNQLKPGDDIQLTYTEAIAASVQPMKKEKTEKNP